VRTPCRTTFAIDGNDASRVTLPSGWTTTQDQLTSMLLAPLSSRPMRRVPKHLQGGDKHRKALQSQRSLRALRAKLLNATRWEIIENGFDNGAGLYRISIPYFLLPGGAALAMMNVIERQGTLQCRLVGDGQYLLPRLEVVRSLDGTRLPDDPEDDRFPRRSFDERHYLEEIDWKTGRVQGLSLRKTNLLRRVGVPSDVNQAYRAAIANFLQTNRHSRYARLNRHVAGGRMSHKFNDDTLTVPTSPAERCWLLFGSKGDLLWREIRFPAVDSPQIRPGDVATLDGRPVDRLLTASHRALGLVSPTRWWLRDQPPASVKLDVDGAKFVQVFEDEGVSQTRNALGLAASFPLGADDLVVIRHERGLILNAAHPVTAAADAESVKAWNGRIDGRLPFADHSQFVRNRHDAASWLLAVLKRIGAPKWSSARERKPDVILYWRACVESQASFIQHCLDLVALQSRPVARLCVVDQSRWKDPADVFVLTTTGLTFTTVARLRDAMELSDIRPSDQLRSG
jgi:hypothetical protein